MKGSHLKGAVLGMLVELGEPIHPYKLGTLINRRLGPTGEIDRDSVYKVLKGLTGRGLVDSFERENPEDSGWRRQRVYLASEATEEALGRWMETGVPETDFRSELQVKIAFSRPSDAPALLRALDAYELDCVRRLAKCEEAEVSGPTFSSWAALAMSVSRNSGEEHVNAELRWIMTTRDWINGYLAKRGTMR